MITAGQALAGEGFAVTVAAVQAIVDFVFIAMAAGDQQVFDEWQEFFSALVRGAFGQFGEDAGFCLLYTSPSPRDQRGSRMPSSA